MPLIAHAADWVITIPAVLFTLWLVVVTLRDRRRRRRDGDDPPRGESRDGL